MVIVSYSARLTLALLLACSLIAAAELTDLRQLSERVPPELRPAMEGRQVRVAGAIAMMPVQLPNYRLLSVQDANGVGIAVEDVGSHFHGLRAGDQVEIEGMLATRAGLPVLRPTAVRKTGSGPAPVPQPLTVFDVARFEYLGRLVEVEGTVLSYGTNAGGDVLSLGASGQTVSVFLPRNPRQGSSGFSSFDVGDRIRVTGLSSQYAPIPPHNGNFQIIIPDSSAAVLVSEAWFVPPATVAFIFVAVTGLVLLWWWRERLASSQRHVLRGIVALSEDVLAASSVREIAQRLQHELPRLIPGAEADLFLFRSSEDVLVRVVTDINPQPLTIPMDAPIGTLSGVIALCLRNRALLRVPDTRKSPILQGNETKLPSSAVFVPTLAQGELMGVFAVYSRKPLSAGADLDVALQHLGNQIAASLRLQERQQMREQLLRSEKMAATGQLISGLANDLRSPLESIVRTVQDLAQIDGMGSALNGIVTEADRGLELIDHLLSFSRMEHRDAKPLDVNALVSEMVELRRNERERKSVHCENLLPVSPMRVLADRSQLEQALLTVLVHAEHAAAQSPDRSFQVNYRLVGRKAIIAFECQRVGTVDPFLPSTFGDYFKFPVAQVIAQSHGGDLRSSRPRGLVRFELELPVYEDESESSSPVRQGGVSRMLTCLLVEPDIISQRRLIGMLAARGHRGVPAGTAEEAADLAQRMQFDAIFCASHLPGLTWLELHQRIRRRIGAFALLSDSWDAEAAQTLRDTEGKVVTRPVSERDLDDFLGFVDVRLAAARN